MLIMDNNLTTVQHLDAIPVARKTKLTLPLLSLGLVFMPIAVFLAARYVLVAGIPMLFALLFPIAGVVTGIAALRQGKEQIGKAGKIIAIISIALPLLLVLLVVLFFIGAVTGIISLM